ncbi:MAG: ATP-binding cassette domain-containing protein [Saprospirales bacterium]|nr:MAG: ATP-binding cassette domain-containing protein [Saprospirales bacterium]
MREKNKRAVISKKGFKSFLKIFTYIRPYRFQFIVGLIFLSIGSLLFMIFPGAAGEMANAAAGQSRFDFAVRDYGLLFLFILVFQGAFSYFRTILFAIVSEKGMADVRKDLFAKIITRNFMFFEERRVGELTSRITADVEQLQSAFSVTLAEFLRQLLVLIVGLVILAWLTPQLAMTMLLIFPLVILVSVVFGRFIRRFSKQRQDEIAQTNTIAEEVIQSFQIVKSFANESYEHIRYGKSVDKVVDISLKFARYKGAFFVFIITILFGSIFFILWRGAIMVESGIMPLGDLFAFILYTGIIGGAIAGLGNLYTTLASAVGASERIIELLDGKGEIDLGEQVMSGSDQLLKGEIYFENVSFSYPGRPELKVLKEVSFHLNIGQKVALVGLSGSGKSTIIKLLLRFYNPDNGKILIDGKPIEEFNLIHLRRSFATVPQEVVLFGGTIRDNIEYGRPGASDEDIRIAAEQANALEFIESFPEGFDSLIGDRGIKLSGGQRQRIAIARAILNDPKVLLLDEATSSLDADSEKVVQSALDNLLENRTALIIAHRLATIKNADLILVLDKGRIVESGTHFELINKGGLYQRLASLQFDLVE